MKTAQRIAQIPPYLFAEIDRKRLEAQARGVDVINLGIGDPDQPTPEPIIRAGQESASDPETHNYPPYEGTLAFREAVATYYQRRFGVELDPRREVMALIGSKEGIAHIVWAYIDPGDIALVPDPAYPVYGVSTRLAGGTPHPLPLLAERRFLPDFTAVPTEVARRAKLLFLNYPNNPTGAVAEQRFFAETVAFAREFDLLLCHDNAYSEITFDGYRAPSLLETPGAKEVAVEFHSLSKTYNMTGWRIGMAVGNKEALTALGVIKTNVDSGAWKAVQRAAIAALLGPQDHLPALNSLYERRRNLVFEGLRHLGWPLVQPPQATFYFWIPVPPGSTSMEFAARLLDEAGIIVPPGIGYGQFGEGYIRMALTAPEERFREALARMERCGIRYKAKTGDEMPVYAPNGVFDRQESPLP